MDKDILQRYFFIAFLILVSILIFFVFLPFIEVILLSIIFAIILSPFHQNLTGWLGGERGLASFLVVLFFAVVIIVPSFLFGVKVLGEANDLYTHLTNRSGYDYIDILNNAIENPVQRFFSNFDLEIANYISSVTDLIIGHLTVVLSSVFNIVTGIILMFISLYFFLLDGANFKKILIGSSPLDNQYDKHIFDKVRQAVISTVRGVLLIAVVQGVLAGVGMFIFGVPNPTLWGSVSAVASLVPGLGTAIIFIPAVAYMFIVGNTPFAIGLLLWGFLIVGLVDNFLGPYLYSKGTEIHQLIMLFAVLGGISFFGPLGFIFGPIIVALFFSLIEIYQTIILNKKVL